MSRHQFAPCLDPLEDRLNLSTLSTSAYLAAKEAVNHALVDLGRTGNLPRALVAIDRAAARIPLSGSLLAPVWKAELETVSRDRPGSALEARRDMFLVLDTHLHRGVEAGVIRVKGPASRLVSRPAINAIDGYSAFSNNSSVTLYLSIIQNEFDRVILHQQVNSGATLRFKVPVEVGVDLQPLQGYRIAIATSENAKPQQGISLRNLINKQIVATNGMIPGEIELQILDENF